MFSFFKKSTIPCSRKGISNLGGTCYANASLQLLFQLRVANDSQEDMLFELNTLQETSDSSQPPKSKPFLQAMYKVHNQFRARLQGDAHEMICCILDDLIRHENRLSGRIQFDDAQLIQKYSLGEKFDFDGFKAEFVATQKRLSREAFDSQTHQKLKTAELQQIQCPGCGYVSLNYSEGTNISLDFPPAREPEPVMALFIVLPCLKNKHQPVYKVGIGMEHLTTGYITYCVNEVIQAMILRKGTEFDGDDDIEPVVNFNSLEFLSFDLKETVEYCQAHQRGCYLDLEDFEDRQQAAEDEKENEKDTSQQLSTKVSTTSEQQTEQVIEEPQLPPEPTLSDPPEQDFPVLKKPAVQILGCITQNQKMFGVDHVMFVTVQNRKKLPPSATQQMVSVVLRPFKPLSLMMTCVNQRTYQEMSPKQQTSYVEQQVLPWFLPFGSATAMGLLRSFAVQAVFEKDEDGTSQTTFVIQCENLQNFARSNAADYDPFVALKAAKGLQIQQLLRLNDCLRHTFGSESRIDGWACPQCKQNEYGTRSVQLVETSQYLIVNFKRFVPVYTDKGVEITKDNQPVDFPELLKLAGKRYRLASVICHFGKLSKGHYVNFSFVDEKWIMFNDDYLSVEELEWTKSYAQVLLYKLE